MVTVNMEFPDEMIAYVNPRTQKEELVRNAMILFRIFDRVRFLMERPQRFWGCLKWI